MKKIRTTTIKVGLIIDEIHSYKNELFVELRNHDNSIFFATCSPSLKEYFQQNISTLENKQWEIELILTLKKIEIFSIGKEIVETISSRTIFTAFYDFLNYTIENK
ncbi:hypothetical protein [Fusobacterium ulcerans]|uniref:hypothetical protein n=1 Tax=Fusobacterium ulcerans TaxID=861 RepID=UPI001D0B2A69|nr:hypothetical protein [Fusobacterium ulcerans]MCB8565794.1 hypothetical protein [Fusobacterium ulcerans]MCB8650639.1 hypothetical protein [Fusobacterium ulcerans]